MNSKFIFSAKKYISNFNNNILFNFKKRLITTILFIIIFRLGSFIPVYGINLINILKKNNINNYFLNIFNVFSGGSLNRISIFSIGIIPYITASMIMQLLIKILPYFKKLKKDNFNDEKYIINKFIIIFTVFISLIQSFITIINLSNIFKYENLLNLNNYTILISILSLVLGTIILTWISEQITDYGIGNGVSILIFIGIVSNLIKYIKYFIKELIENKINIITLILIFLILFILINISVFIECSQRRILVNYPKQYFFKRDFFNISNNTYLPIKLNISGIMPAIFSSSFMIICNIFLYFLNSKLKSNLILNILKNFKSNNILYIITHIFFIFLFYFIYSPISFNIKETSENLKKSGAFIINIRPGKNTYEYIKKIVNKITIIGAIYISFICSIPDIIKLIYNIDINGISILIISVVVIDIITQIQSIIVSSQYESILNKIKIK